MLISGLKAAPQYNDSYATIVSWDQAKGRWKVKMDMDGSNFRLKPENCHAIGTSEESEAEKKKREREERERKSQD